SATSTPTTFKIQSQQPTFIDDSVLNWERRFRITAKISGELLLPIPITGMSFGAARPRWVKSMAQLFPQLPEGPFRFYRRKPCASCGPSGTDIRRHGVLTGLWTR